jgi:hypothetical protein
MLTVFIAYGPKTSAGLKILIRVDIFEIYEQMSVVTQLIISGHYHLCCKDLRVV